MAGFVRSRQLSTKRRTKGKNYKMDKIIEVLAKILIIIGCISFIGCFIFLILTLILDA